MTSITRPASLASKERRHTPSTPTVFAILSTVLVVSVVIALFAGAVPLTPVSVLRAVLGDGDATSVIIIRELRLPRAIQSVLVGAALSMSGATFQSLLRNPLADPYILGVSSGAAAGAVLAVVFGWHNSAIWALPAAAFAGALIAIALVMRIALGAAGGRDLDTRILLLAGVVVGAFLSAVIMLVLTFADVESFRSAIFWMMGSNSGSTWGSGMVLAVYFVVGLVLLISIARALDLIAAGELTATYLGVRVTRIKWIAYGTASLLAAAAVSAAGVIGFVGLVIPHAIRLAWTSENRLLIPASALLGGSFLAGADTVARVAAAPTELPVGVVTAFVGVPFFIWLLRRRAGAA
jgi:iron complex transport system permease protein